MSAENENALRAFEAWIATALLLCDNCHKPIHREVCDNYEHSENGLINCELPEPDDEANAMPDLKQVWLAASQASYEKGRAEGFKLGRSMVDIEPFIAVEERAKAEGAASERAAVVELLKGQLRVIKRRYANSKDSKTKEIAFYVKLALNDVLKDLSAKESL